MTYGIVGAAGGAMVGSVKDVLSIAKAPPTTSQPTRETRPPVATQALEKAPPAESSRPGAFLLKGIPEDGTLVHCQA